MADFYITYGDVGWELQITAKDATGTVVNILDYLLMPLFQKVYTQQNLRLTLLEEQYLECLHLLR
jgi:hypothetical protein